MMHFRHQFSFLYLYGFIWISFFIAPVAAAGGTVSKKASSPAETFEKPVPVHLDALEGVLEKAGNEAVEAKAKTGRVNVKVQTAPVSPTDTVPVTRNDGVQGPLKIEVTPLIATPIQTGPKNDVETVPAGVAGYGDGAGYLRIGILIVSVSTFLLSGALLIRKDAWLMPGAANSQQNGASTG